MVPFVLKPGPFCPETWSVFVLKRGPFCRVRFVHGPFFSMVRFVRVPILRVHFLRSELVYICQSAVDYLTAESLAK